VQLVISDTHAGLKNAIASVLLGAHGDQQDVNKLESHVRRAR
jgi:hypothetical protein